MAMGGMLGMSGLRKWLFGGKGEGNLCLREQ